jgi:hypothetical protein
VFHTLLVNPDVIRVAFACPVADLILDLVRKSPPIRIPQSLVCIDKELCPALGVCAEIASARYFVAELIVLAVIIAVAREVNRERYRVLLGSASTGVRGSTGLFLRRTFDKRRDLLRAISAEI